AGSLSDRFGYIRFMYIGIILSIIGSLLVIITANAGVMLIGRVVQGFSAAMLMPATISILNNVFEGEQRRAALSWWSIGAFGGTGFASLFAGFISTYFFWQITFIISIIIALIALYLLKDLRNVRLVKGRRTGRLDFLGVILFTVSLSALSVFI